VKAKEEKEQREEVKGKDNEIAKKVAAPPRPS
jgi:hypothetical protein